MALELPRISAVRYVARSAAAEQLRSFYCNVCGLVEESKGSSRDLLDFRLPGAVADRSAHLVFDVSGRAEQRDADSDSVHTLHKNYWKVGFALDDVAAGVASINTKAGRSVVKPASQFMDVGLLTHMGDPVGLSIELLGTTQQVESASGRANTDKAVSDQQDRLSVLQRLRSPEEGVAPALGQNSPHSVVGQLTLRNSNAFAAVAFWRTLLGMQLLCRENVAQYGFVLFFLGYLEGTGQSVPANIDDVKVREWTYQLPLTTVEIQATGATGDLSQDKLSREQLFAQCKASLTAPNIPALEKSSGGLFAGCTVCVPAMHYDWIAENAGNKEAPRVYLQDPDGTPVEIFRESQG